MVDDKELILVVDDEPAICYAFKRFFEKRGFAVSATGDVDKAFEECEENGPLLVFLDVRLGGADGLELLARIKEASPALPVVVMTAFGSLETVSRAMELHAFDYVTKPLDMSRAEALVKQVQAANKIRHEVPAVECGFAGASPVMQQLFKQLLKIAALDAPVLINGETGTGKELAARLIHSRSRRAKGPFIPVNCGALPEHLVESELFGHKKGTFTGAIQDKVGLCEAADKGVLFLDEVGDLPLTAQVKLLRFLDQRQVERLGGTAPVDVDVRVLAATNRDLHSAVESGRFRADLYYRIAVLQVKTPSLEQHKEDVPELAAHFLRQFDPSLSLSREAVELLVSRSWPGNVRELRNAVWQAAAAAQGSVVTADCVSEHKGAAGESSGMDEDWLQKYVDSLPFAGECLHKAVDELQTRLIRRALAESGGNQTAAAEKLGLHRNSLRRMMDDLKVQ